MLLLEVPAGTLPSITLLVWASIAPAWPSFYTWPALGQWITKRQMGFERNTFPFGCLVSGYTACHVEFWLVSGLMAPSSCSFVQGTTLIFLLVTHSTAQDKLKILQWFIKERIQNYRRVWHRDLEFVTIGIRNSEVYRDEAYYAKEGGRLVGMWWWGKLTPNGKRAAAPQLQLVTAMWKWCHFLSGEAENPSISVTFHNYFLMSTKVMAT